MATAIKCISPPNLTSLKSLNEYFLQIDQLARAMISLQVGESPTYHNYRVESESIRQFWYNLSYLDRHTVMIVGLYKGETDWTRLKENLCAISRSITNR